MTSLFARNGASRETRAPLDPVSWERWILQQQGSLYSVRNHRRHTVEGIPGFKDFQKDWEDRYAYMAAYGTPIDEEDEPRSRASESNDFDPGDLGEGLRSSSKRSSQQSSQKRTKYQSKYSSPIPMYTGRYSSYNSPKRNRFGSSDRGFHTISSTDSLADTARKDKARFYAEQQADKKNKRRFHESALPPVEEFFRVQQPQAPSNKPQDLRTTSDLYRDWHESCTAALADKSTMTEIPTPPIPACSLCQRIAISSHLEIPLTCGHSMDELYRAAIEGSFAKSDSSPSYFQVLKEERNKWHTDRFSACKVEYKAKIQDMARLLFVATNELFIKEKARLDMAVRTSVVPNDPKYYTNEYFDITDDNAW